MTARGPAWTQADDDRLTALWLEGKLSSAAIGVELGRSKNAIIGRAHRIGLSLKIVKRKGPPRQSRKKLAVMRRVLVERRQKPQWEPPMITPIDRPTPRQSKEGCTLLELTQDTCRWPLDGEPVRFCGKLPTGTSPYCTEHDRMAYRSPERRRAA